MQKTHYNNKKCLGEFVSRASQKQHDYNENNVQEQKK